MPLGAQKASLMAASNAFTGMVATGGTITTDGNFKVHTFNTGATFEVTQIGSLDTVEFLVIAGGGGGGGAGGNEGQGGGGGAGGLRNSYASESSGGGASTQTVQTVTATTYVVAVGAGGVGGANINGTQGSASSIAGFSDAYVVVALVTITAPVVLEHLMKVMVVAMERHIPVMVVRVEVLEARGLLLFPEQV